MVRGFNNQEEEWLKLPSDRLSLPLIIVTVGVVLTFSLVIFLLFLRLWFGSFGLAEFLSGGVRPAKIKVALLDSGYTAQELRKLGGDYAGLIKQWQTLLEPIQGKTVSFEKISDAQLEKGLGGFEVLLLPSALALSDKQLQVMRAFVKEGGGLFISWAAGTRAPDGSWRGWQFINELVSVEVTPAPTLESGRSLFTMLRSDSPLASGIEPGQRLTIIPRSQPLVAAASGYDAYWARPVLTPEKKSPKLIGVRPVFLEPAGGYGAAIAHRALGRGRVVWVGFGLDSLSESFEDTRLFQQFLLNSFAWLGQRPVAAVKTWPADHQAAAVFSLDVEQDFANALEAQAIFKEKGLQGSFFLVSELAKRHPELVSRLAGVGEIAVHGDIHKPFADEAYELQLKRLSTAKKELEKLSGQPVIGFRAPELSMDDNTIKAAAALDIKYVGVSHDRASYPKVIDYPERVPGKVAIGSAKVIVLFPQAFNDDYRLFHIRGLSAQQALKEWKEELAQVIVQRGLFFFSSHTTSPWGLLSGRAQLLAELLETAKRQKVWISPATQVADWILQRAKLAVKAELNETGKISLTVSNSGAEGVPRATVYLYLPYSFQGGRLEVPGQFSGKVDHSYSQEEGRQTVHFKSLKAGEVRWVYVRRADALARGSR